MQSIKFDNDENLAIFEIDFIELVQTFGNKRKSHPKRSDFLNWWGIIDNPLN